MSRTLRTELRSVFAMRLPVRYHIEGEAEMGTGQTVAIGSEIVRFQGDRNLKTGYRIRLELAWPALLPDGTSLNLWMSGRVSSSSLAEIEVRVTSYEFRTRRKTRAEAGTPASGGAAPSLIRVAQAGA